MKKKTYQINIPEPCNEDWNKMTPQEQGRFCGKCAKVIVDYTLQPDRVIAKALKENNGQICGRFRSDQLQRDLVFEPQFYQNTRWKAFGLMISGLLAAGTLKGQDNIALSEGTELVNANDKKEAIFQDKIVVSGKILATDSKEALVAATILLKGSTIGCATDANGQFQLEISTEQSHLIKNELVLEISYLGYQPKTLTVKKEALQNNLKIALEDTYLKISSVNIPTIEFYSDGVKRTSYVVGGLIHEEKDVQSEELQSSRKDQTLYQLIKKKIRERKARNKSSE